MLRVLDLFSGIGGFSLGLEATGGFRTVAFCEVEHYPRRVLARHWPGVPIYGDVRTLTAERLGADGIAPDVICGGFPCQDISLAGKGDGLDGARSGLWREFARLAGELRPRYLIVENTSALLGRGLGRILGELASLGLDSEWHCIPASAIGAPHKRDRIWIVAWAPGRANADGWGRQVVRLAQHAGERRQPRPLADGLRAPGRRDGEASADADGLALRVEPGREFRARRAGEAFPGDDGPQEPLADADGGGRQQRGGARGLDGGRPEPQDGGQDVADPGGGRQQQPWPEPAHLDAGAGDQTHVPLADSEGLEVVLDGDEAELASTFGAHSWGAEPDVGRVAYGVPSRVDRIKGLGNAVVPQIPHMIGRAILECQ